MLALLLPLPALLVPFPTPPTTTFAHGAPTVLVADAMTAKEKIEAAKAAADEKLAARGQVAAETKLIVDPNKIFNDLVESENKEAKEEIFGAGSTDEDYLFGRKQKLTKAQSAQLNQKRILQQQKQQREANSRILALTEAPPRPRLSACNWPRAEAMKDKPLIDIQLPSVSLPSVSLPSLPF